MLPCHLPKEGINKYLVLSKLKDIYKNVVFTYNDVADTVIQRFVAKIWNNLKACVIV